ncbi:acyloxyacyl hydrolase [Mangrovibacterium lignilyticum]|uniref:acyloxyacyl hydrolase n=1 Tax=Mangrovibacterium lignilyticum TaxID=2668052 RepID=UPI0013D7687B|nr:acyloxyacyl hydrolase [Mangrovibacterium lignilyticum]
MSLKHKIALFLLLIFTSVVDVQATNPLTSLFKKDSLQTEPKRYSFFSTRYHAGRVLQTNDFLRGENLQEEPITSFHALAFSYGVQTAGQKEWHHVLNFPYYGVSFYNANFFNSQELGYPTALYGFMGFPFKRTKRSTVGYELGFGLTYNWQAYDPYRNPFNIAIGSNKTVYIDASLFYSYDLTPRWQLKTGLGFTHFSNGATKKPNSGLNLVSPFIEVNYSLHDRPILIREKQPDYLDNYELAVQMGVGKKQESYKNPEDEELKIAGSFAVVNFSAAILKQVSWKNKFGAGVDITHDTQGNVKISYDQEGIPVVHKSEDFLDLMKVGIYGTYEFCVNHLSVASHLGFYALRKSYPGQQPFIYQKFGLKYHFKNDVYIGLLVRAHKFTVADVIEWNVGYRLKWY